MSKKWISWILAVACLFTLTAGMLSGCRSTKVQVSFDWNYDDAPEAPAAIEAKTGKAYGALPEVTAQREGYTFAGWYLDEDCAGEAVTAETVVTAEEDHTLYAKWEGVELTVSFDLQGGNINGVSTVEPVTVIVGNVYSMMSIPDDPERDNYTFLGWYYDAEGMQGPVTASTKVIKTEDHTLYAKWKENQLLYNFENPEDISAFTNRGNGLLFQVAQHGDGNQLMITNPNEGKSDEFLVMWADLKAGTRVTMDVTVAGELAADSRMHIFCYGANIVGDPITTGLINKSLSDAHRRWYDGNGCRVMQNNGTWYHGDEGDWKEGSTFAIDFVVMEDCSGLSMWVNLGSGMDSAQWMKNAIYIDNIAFEPGYMEITDADFGGEEQKPQEETEGETEFPFTFECGSVDSDIFKLRDSNLKMSVVEYGGSQMMKLQLSRANGKAWLWMNKAMSAGTAVTFDVIFDRGATGAAMSIFGYGSKSNGDPITVQPAGSNIPIGWYNGQGVKAQFSGSTNKQTVTVNIHENCYGISLMLGFDGNPDTSIYLDNFRVGKMSGSEQETTTGETDFPFTFECGGVSSDVFKLRGSDLEMAVESYGDSQQLKVQPTKADGTFWLWLNKELKAGSKVTMDVTLVGENVSIFGYGSKATGDPITEGTPTDSIPQNWYWGQGGSTNGSYTFNIYEDCHGLSLMLGFGSNTNAAIYIDNVKLVQPGEEVPGETVPEENAGNNVGVLSAHSAGINVDSATGAIKGIYAVGAATNAVYGEDWSVEYAPVFSQNLRLIRDGEVHNVGVPGVGTLVLISPVDYYLKIENQVFNGNWLPLCQGDLLVLEGQFVCKKDENSIINIERTYIQIADDAVEFSANGPEVPEVPEIKPSEPLPEQPGVETESPFTFDDGMFSAEIFNNRNNGMTVTVENGKLKLQQPANAGNWLWIKQELTAGTVITMDVSFSDTGMSIFGYGSKANGDPMTEGEPTATIPQTWYWGQGGSESGSYTFNIYEDCHGLSLMLGFANSTETAIYIDNVVITAPSEEETTEPEVEETTEPEVEETTEPSAETESPFTFDGGVFSAEIFNNRNNGMTVTVENGKLKLQQPAGASNWLWIKQELTAGTLITMDVSFSDTGMSIFGYGSKANGDPMTEGEPTATIPQTWYWGQGGSESGSYTFNIYEDCHGLSLMLGFANSTETAIYIDNVVITAPSEEETTEPETTEPETEPETTEPETTAPSAETESPFTFDSGVFSAEIFNNRNNGMTVTVENGKLKLQQPAGASNWLWIKQELTAGTVITMDVSFSDTGMSIFGYGSKANGDPITEGTPTESIPQGWYWGQGGSESGSYTFTIYEDCHGLSLMLGFANSTETAIYIDNVVITAPSEEETTEPETTEPEVEETTEPEVEETTDPEVEETTEPSAETESPFTFDNGVFSAEIFNNRNNGMTVTVENGKLKLQQPANAGNWLWIKQELTAGTVITMDVSFSDTGMSVFGYGSKANGDPITEGTPTESIPQGWYWGQGGNESGSYTFNIYEDCHGLSLMLGFAGSTETAICIDNVVITAPSEEETTEPETTEPETEPETTEPETTAPSAETESPFTFDSGVFSAEIFNNRNNGMTVTVENGKLKLQQPAGASNWLWIKQELTAGTVITMDVSFSDTGMSIFGYGSKANGDPITEGTPTESIPQGWYWGQGGSESGSYTFNIYEDCHGLSLMLGFANSTETAIYIDNVVITAPSEEETTEPEVEETTEPDVTGEVNAGMMLGSNNAATANGIYFTMAENAAPYDEGWNLYYNAKSADSIKLIRDGETYSIALVDRQNICKFSTADYYLRLEEYTIGTYAPFSNEDIFVVEGSFVYDEVTLIIDKTYIYHDGTKWVFAAELPEDLIPDQSETTEPETTEPDTEADFPFAFDDGEVPDDIFMLRESDLTMTIAEQDGSQQLKMQTTNVSGNNFLWLKKDLKAGTVITMDVTFQRTLGKMSIYLYGAQENGDPITVGTATDTVPQNWFDGQGIAATFPSSVKVVTETVTFTVYEDCSGISMMLGFGNKKNAIYLDNIQITQQGGGESTEPETTEPETTEPAVSETDFPFTFESGSYDTSVLDKRNSELDMSVVSHNGSNQLKIMYIGTSNWLWLHRELKAGDKISFDVTFDNAGTGDGMNIFCYGSKENGDPITEGTVTEAVPQGWFWGQGVNADFTSGNTNTQTVSFTVYEDCEGMSMMLGFGDTNKTQTAIYLDNIVISES